MLTLKLKTDLLDLAEAAKKLRVARGESQWSDSSLCKACFNHGEYLMNLRKWSGGTGGPTLEKTLQLETFLREYLGPSEYEKFLKTRSRPTMAPAGPVNDFD